MLIYLIILHNNMIFNDNVYIIPFFNKSFTIQFLLIK